MCMHFLFYYPLENGFKFCGLYRENGLGFNLNMCGGGIASTSYSLTPPNPVTDGDTDK